MAASSSCFPDVWSWIQNLPPITQWNRDSMSLGIYSLKSTKACLKFSITKNTLNHTPSVFFSIIVDYNTPISLWNSKSFKTNSQGPKILDEEITSSLFNNFINGVLNYGPMKNTTFLHIPPVDTISHFKEIFDLSVFTLTLLTCIYEAPHNIRSECLTALENYLTSSYSREISKMLMRLLGSNIEEQWMRSLNLAITNWVVELKASKHSLRAIVPLFSYAFSTFELCKVQLYCPIVAMDIETSSESSPQDRLKLSLRYHQLEGVIQFAYNVIPQEEYTNVVVKVDNIRCDVVRLVTKTLMAKRGAGEVEKHFPSRISLQLTPAFQTNVLSVSVGRSSENPIHDIGTGMSVDAGFTPPTSIGLNVTASETTTMSLKPWKFEQSVYGYSANLNWYLHNLDGREVISSKPPKTAMCCPRTSWFKDRYSKASRAFTKQGGVIFAKDEYGDAVVWKVDKGQMGKSMEWELKGWIWLTYWPNKLRTFHNETRRFEFTETLNISLT
ncbi:hypothetical protein AQUCO_00400461v1 [Aquilegia coerulea]|uniref:Uncharacterized protein n=1 Tax=Aquilegia coerulea TaxID=218851 RepID=A0A2G5EV00_AQUCA|nr:hypothetical protein AQUCO_00400461v1 [Aquilegia coerulea]